MISWVRTYAIEWVLADVLKPVLDKLPGKGNKTVVGALTLIAWGILYLISEFVSGSAEYVEPVLQILLDSGLVVTGAGLLGKAGDNVATKRLSK